MSSNLDQTSDMVQPLRRTHKFSSLPLRSSGTQTIRSLVCPAEPVEITTPKTRYYGQYVPTPPASPNTRTTKPPLPNMSRDGESPSPSRTPLLPIAPENIDIDTGSKDYLENFTRILEKRKVIRPNLSPFLRTAHKPFLEPQDSRSAGKITLLLDIDETLLHAEPKLPIDAYPGEYIEILVNDEVHGIYTLYLKFRPYLREFFAAINDLYEIVLFTAGTFSYASVVMQLLCEKFNAKIANLLDRSHCVSTFGGAVKDVSLIGRPLDRIIIIDNMEYSFAFQPRNSIHIETWLRDQRDTALARLIPILEHLSNVDSVYEYLDYLDAAIQTSPTIKGTPKRQSLNIQ